jgi:hypothetical protein
MKRTVLVCLVLTLLASALMAPAGAAKPSSTQSTRRAIVFYDVPTLGSASGTGGAGCFPCPRFVLSEEDRLVTMDVEDDVSFAPVAFDIRESRPDGSCCDKLAGPYCGSTGNQAVKTTQGRDVFVFVFAYGDDICPGAIATSGTITAVFSNGAD